MYGSRWGVGTTPGTPDFSFDRGVRRTPPLGGSKNFKAIYKAKYPSPLSDEKSFDRGVRRTAPPLVPGLFFFFSGALYRLCCLAGLVFSARFWVCHTVSPLSGRPVWPGLRCARGASVVSIVGICGMNFFLVFQ